jgi:hypothetical protein
MQEDSHEEDKGGTLDEKIVQKVDCIFGLALALLNLIES